MDTSRLEQEPATVETLRAVADRYLETRIDATGNTLKTYRQAFAHLGALGDLSPNTWDRLAQQQQQQQ